MAEAKSVNDNQDEETAIVESMAARGPSWGPLVLDLDVRANHKDTDDTTLDEI